LTVARLKATLETAGVEFLAACGRRMFFDGEFQVDGALKSTPAHFGSRGPRGDAGVLHLFDMLPLDDWRADRCKEPCSHFRSCERLRSAEAVRCGPLPAAFGARRRRRGHQGSRLAVPAGANRSWGKLKR
jgi:hypothetical protein